jgi:hypothetical protein
MVIKLKLTFFLADIMGRENAGGVGGVSAVGDPGYVSRTGSFAYAGKTQPGTERQNGDIFEEDDEIKIRSTSTWKFRV